MSTLDMPLTQIAHLLPTRSAAVLSGCPSAVQILVLSEIRMIVHRWEQSGVSLDPITFAKVLGPVADQLTVSQLALQSTLSEQEEG